MEILAMQPDTVFVVAVLGVSLFFGGVLIWSVADMSISFNKIQDIQRERREALNHPQPKHCLVIPEHEVIESYLSQYRDSPREEASAGKAIMWTIRRIIELNK